MAAQPDRVITVAEAIAKAEDCLRQPELLFDTAGARRVILGLLAGLQSSPTYFRALKRGEEVFVLRQRDRAAPDAIKRWCELSSNHGCPQEKIEQAQVKADRWTAQPLSLTRWAD